MCQIHVKLYSKNFKYFFLLKLNLKQNERSLDFDFCCVMSRYIVEQICKEWAKFISQAETPIFEKNQRL